jgi:hypothetical protein
MELEIQEALDAEIDEPMDNFLQIMLYKLPRKYHVKPVMH